MSYQQYLETHAEALGKSAGAKAARDLAKVLDNPLFRLKPNTSYSKYQVGNRETVFNLFCAVCLAAHIPVPELEPELYESLLLDKIEQKHHDKIKAMNAQLSMQLTDQSGEDADLCRGLMAVLKLFPNCFGFQGIDGQQLVAAINHRLMSMGLSPLRPDYGQIEIKLPIYQAGPTKMAKVLVVDDELGGLMKTASALAGFPNLRVEIFHFNQDRSRGSQRDKVLRESAKAIVALKPQIVLMDQGLGGIDGHELIGEIQRLATDQIVFVANTDGTPDEQYEVGALTNCRKGQDLQGVRDAIARLG